MCACCPAGAGTLAAAGNADKDNLTRNDRVEQLPAMGGGAPYKPGSTPHLP